MCCVCTSRSLYLNKGLNSISSSYNKLFLGVSASYWSALWHNILNGAMGGLHKHVVLHGPQDFKRSPWWEYIPQTSNNNYTLLHAVRPNIEISLHVQIYLKQTAISCLCGQEVWLRHLCISVRKWGSEKRGNRWKMDMVIKLDLKIVEVKREILYSWRRIENQLMHQRQYKNYDSQARSLFRCGKWGIRFKADHKSLITFPLSDVIWCVGTVASWKRPKAISIAAVICLSICLSILSMWYIVSVIIQFYAV